MSKIVFIRDILKRKSTYHTIDSASILPEDCDELTDEDLEHVVGGMSPATFQEWRVSTINRTTSKPWEES